MTIEHRPTADEPAPTVPEPGIYPDALAGDYHGWDACSSTRLKWMDRSPAFCWWMMRHKKPPTPAMLLGTAGHYAVLEPGQFETRYAVAGQCEATVAKTGKRCGHAGVTSVGGAWYCGTRGHAALVDELEDPRLVLSATEYARVCAIRDAVHGHAVAASLLNRAGVHVEASIVWDHDGLRCKGRPDAYSDYGSLIDLKVTRDAHPDRIERFVAKMGTHRQLALYTEGMQELGVNIERQYIIAVEPEPPHEVCVYRAHAELMRAGVEHVRRLRTEYAQCKASGTWQGYPRAETELGVPQWLTRELFPEDYAEVALRIGGVEEIV